MHPPLLSSRRHLLLAGLSVAAAGCATGTGSAPRAGAYLLQGGYVLSMDEAIGDLATGDVLVRDGRIVAVGPALDAAGAERIDMRGRIVMPGFVDTHWHMWNTIARGMGSSTAGPFSKTMAALSQVWTPQASALGVRLACAEAASSGITTVHNWAHNVKSAEFAEAELAALRASGLRGRFAYGYPQSLQPGQAMDFGPIAAMQARAFAGATDGLLTLGVALRGPDRSAGPVWRQEIDAARALHLPVTAHVASDRASAANGLIAVMHREKYLGPDVQVVHATHASANDFALLREAGSPLSISPWTELEVGYGLPALREMAASGVQMGLSVDNMVLAGQADMFSVMRLTIDLASGMQERQDAIGHRKALDWATIGGARSLGLAATTGSLTPGKRADVIAIARNTLNTRPVRDVPYLLTHAARPSDVDFVLVDGQVHKRDGRLTRVDVPALLDKAEATMAALRRQAGV